MYTPCGLVAGHMPDDSSHLHALLAADMMLDLALVEVYMPFDLLTWVECTQRVVVGGHMVGLGYHSLWIVLVSVVIVFF